MSAAANDFAFKPGDLVLVKWNDSMVYFAKIKKIDQRRKKCVVVFDDKSHDEADFDQIHSVDETTTDIICIKCKRDDSDTPNEIVLCDRCGIGYHQKCHIPPIPASALELDTPWNCVYCLKGVKCPYLTESLDVLQNLLSDEECQSHDDMDMDSVTTAESDEGGEEFTQPPVQHGHFLAPPKPQKKRGRKPKVKRGPKPKDPSIRKSKSPGVDVSKQKDGNTGSDSGLKTESGLLLKRRRPQFAAVAVQKRPRKSSVQSQTLSVTRISVPVHEDNISPRSEKGEDSSKSINSSGSNQSLPLNTEASKNSQISQNNTPEVSPQLPAKKPRHLRVSLSLPEEVEPGSPLEKIVMKSEKLHSPKFLGSSLPLWDDDPKAQIKLSGSSETPVKSPAQSTPGSEVGNSSQTNAVSNPSPTPSNEGPLTPFTASALPLKPGGVENKDTRKRKSPDVEDTVDSATPPLKKANLSSPLGSPADDVFTSPKTSGTNVVQRQTTTPSMSIVETKSADIGSQPSPAATSTESQMDINILPGAPVGYGTTLSALEQPKEQATPPAVTPTVITVQPSLEDKATPNHLSPTSKASKPEIISPVLVTVVKEPRLESSPQQTPAVAKEKLVVSPNLQTSPERQAMKSLPLIPPTTEQSKPIKPTLSPEKVATVSSTDTPVVPVSASSGPVQTIVQSLPQQSKSPSVIMSSPRQSVSTVTSSSGNSHSSAMPLVKSRPKNISTRDDPTRSTAAAAAAVSVITAPVISTPSTPTSVPTAVSHVKSAVQSHTPKAPSRDIVIASVETRPQSSTVVSGKTPLSLPSYTEAVQNRIINSTILPSTTSNAPVTTSHALKGRMQSLFVGGKPPGQQTVPGSRRVMAKIADIQPGPVAITQARSRPHQRSTSQYHQIQSRAAVKSSQTPVSVVLAASTPTVAYTQTMARDGTAYIIPADAVVQGGQGVAITTRRAIPPGSLPINSTAVVVQQPTAVKYIIEPAVPAASTSVVYSQTASIPAVTSSQATASVVPASIYHVQAPNAKSTPVTTTKPYAIVPAQPTTSVEIPGITVDQQGTPVVSAQLPVGYSVIPGKPYIHAAVTPTADPSSAKQVAYTTEKKPASSNGPPSKPLPKIVSRGNNHADRALSEQTLTNLDEIGKRIGEAFANCSEQMLIAAFEDAWRRFQANGKKYQTTATSRRIGNSENAVSRSVPPNAEVVSVPGTSSRLSLIRPTYSRSKTTAPKANSDQLIHVSDGQQLPIQNLGTPPSQLSQQKQQVQYLYCPDYPIYAIAPNSAQPPRDQLKQGQTYQVQSSGVYIPVCTSQSNNTQPTIVLEQVIGSNKPLAQQQVSRNQIALAEKTVSLQQTADQIPVQHCSALRKPQPNTIIENGGYSVIKQKDSSTTVKTVRQCAQCTNEATYLCSGCHRIWYCGKDCQLKAWDEHSESCKS